LVELKEDPDGTIKAAGRYQIIPGTLKGLVNQGVVSKDDKFNAATQDKLATSLIDARIRKGGGDPIKTQLELAKEFAAIADPATGKSYHEGKGNNKASISSAQMQAALTGSTTRSDVLVATNKVNESKAAAEKAKEEVAAAKPLFTQEDLTALANALKSQSMTGGGMTTAALVSKATPYERDFYMGVVRGNAL